MSHHQYSPSKFNAWANCVHYESVERESSEASAGTEAHAELEKGLRDANYEPNTYVSRWALEEIRLLSDGIDPSSEMHLCGQVGELNGITGTADVLWEDAEGFLHIADLKTFSDGTENYIPQLMCYAALWCRDNTPCDLQVFLHVLHGGICKVESHLFTIEECVKASLDILLRVKEKREPENICKHCQYCSKVKECPMANHAVEVVNNQVEFGKLSLPQKLVVCDAVEKLIKSLKEEAKQTAIDNGGVLEADGIRYEIKSRCGKGRVTDLCHLAGEMENPPEGYIGLSNENLLSICDLPKSALVDAVKAANAENKSVKKKDLEIWCASFYTKGEPVQYLSRVK